MVFKCLVDARDFQKITFSTNVEYEQYAIYECQVINAKKTDVICRIIGLINDFWNNITKLETERMRFCDIMNAPVGTYFADSVKLTRKVM
jgi:hypothetical protein